MPVPKQIKSPSIKTWLVGIVMVATFPIGIYLMAAPFAFPDYFTFGTYADTFTFKTICFGVGTMMTGLNCYLYYLIYYDE